MQLGDHKTAERAEQSQLAAALDTLDKALNRLIDTVEAGGLDQLNAAEKLSFWQRFEAFRNRLPLMDHRLIADAEASDLAGEYCFSSLTMLLTRRLLLSPTEAVSRVRAAAAVGRTSRGGERMGTLLPNLAAAQRGGAVSPEQVRIVERAMQKLTDAELNRDKVAAAEQQLAKQAQLHGPKDLQKIASRVVAAVDPESAAPIDDQLQQDRPLALGRTRRIASRGQTMALIAREGGCSFPGCDHPPQWCDRHHILDWILGGPTDLDNLTLLCRYHHTHFLQKGWACRMNADGLPEWMPPRWIDPEQRPQLHARIRRLHAQRQLGRRRRPAKAA
jgi:hypothetical protein